jgi:DNA-binding MarR family transcriptional regulator
MHILCANKLGALGVLLTDAIHEALGELSPSAASLLLTLYYQGPMTATALAGVGGIAQPTAVRVADRLVRLGLIRRESHLGRTAPLHLTTEGKRQARALQRVRLVAMNRLLGRLSKTEQSHFEKVIDKILRHATHSRAFARTTCRLCDHSVCDGSRCPVGSQASALERQMNSSEISNQ